MTPNPAILKAEAGLRATKAQKVADELQGRLAHYKAKAEQLEKHLKKVHQQQSVYREYVDDVKRAVTALDPRPRVPFVSKKSSSPITAVIKFSDFHIGDVISAEETEGFGKYNWTIAQERAQFIVDSFLHWIKTQRSGYSIEKCVILCEGDFISGDIHQELTATAEFPVPVQTAKAGQLLGWLFDRIAEHFAEVEIVEVGADNHSRLVRKPQCKQKASNSLSHLVYEIADSFIAKNPRVRIFRADGMKMIHEINGYRFLIEHGDVIKAFSGTPYYSMEREKAREAVKRMHVGGFHYQSIAHWHCPALINGTIIVNGSLCGTSEYDASQGRHAPPAQVAFLVGRHGLFNFVPFTTKI